MRAATRPLVVAITLVIVVAVPGFAADTGTISGAAFDKNGEPVADAAVKVSGAPLPMGRTAQTGANGLYQFQYLVPGEYLVEIEKIGVGSAKRVAIVEVGRDTQVEFILGLTLQEEVTVNAARPIVDIRSAGVGFNFRDDTLNSLPLERTYRGLFQLIPGVPDNRSPIGPAAGGSRQDNTYLIDGANITSPAFGYLSTEINELDIAEVNIKRGGISAEFGRTAGTVVNAVSRSGSNRFAGMGRVDWLSDDLVSAYELPDDLMDAGVQPGVFRDPLLTTELMPAFGLGGPVVQNRMFFYTSARHSRETKWDRFNKVGTPLPDEVRTGPEFFGKLNFAAAVEHQLTGSFRHRPNHVENAGTGSDFAPSVASRTDNSSRIATAEWASFIGTSQTVNVRYLYMKEKNEDEPITNLGYLPTFNTRNLPAMGQYTDPLQANLMVGGGAFTNVQNYQRHEVRGTFSQFFDIGKTSHTLKSGFAYEFAEEFFNRTANGWGAIVNQTQSGVPALRARYYTPQSPQVGLTHTYALFVQDDVMLRTRASLNLGLLLNRDAMSQRVDGSGGCPAVLLQGGSAVYESDGDTCTFLRFGFTQEVQPRVGLTYQLREGTGDKAYAHWGRYYNLDQKSSARSLAPRRIFQTQTFFDMAGNILSSGPLASTTGKLIDPDIEPIYSDEVLVGYAAPLAEGYSLDMFFMFRKMNNFIEDLPSRINGSAPDAGPFVAANLPCSRFAACQAAEARRTYRAFTVDLRRRFANRWMGNVNYTWSRFEGNFDLDYTTVAVFNTSSFIQDAPGANVEDPNRFGPLFEDRPHVVKLFTSYDVTSRFSAAAYLRLQAGTPWAARGRDFNVVLNYLEPAGSHRNPTWTNLDLLASYRLPLVVGASISLEARLLNVFDNQTRLATDSQQYLDLQTQSTPPYILPYQQPNPFFGMGNAFAPPRRLHLAAIVSF
jgi:Carboxypeptidase regulatory-like domain